MANKTYLDRLKMSTSEKQEEDINFHVEQKELQLSADTSATKKSLMEKKRNREEYAGSKDLDFTKLSEMDDEITSLEAGLKRLESYKSEFFSES